MLLVLFYVFIKVHISLKKQWEHLEKYKEEIKITYNHIPQSVLVRLF